MSFGMKVRALRKERGMSQKTLAAKTGIDFTYLSKVENERSPPPSEEVIRSMADALSTDSDELIRLAGKVPSDVTQFLLTHPEAIQHLRSFEGGARQFYVQAGAVQVDVIVATRLGRKYLKTKNDGETPDNLLALPECP